MALIPLFQSWYRTINGDHLNKLVNILNGTSAAPAGLSATSFTATGNVSSLYDQVSTATGLTAVGSSRTDALALTHAINNVTTVGSGTGVILPPASTVGIGGVVIVFNGDGTNAAQVYGAGSDTIDGTAGSTGVALTHAKRCAYYVVAANTYISAQLGAVSA